MTVQQIIEQIRTELNTNAAKVPDAYLLDGVKFDDDILWLKALRYSGDASFAMDHAYADLVSATGLPKGVVGHNGEYPFPCDLARPVRIEIDTTGNGVYQEVKMYDIGDYTYRSEVGGEGQLGYGPYVRFEKKAMHIRPLPTNYVPEGIHIWYEKRLPSLTINDTPSIDSTLSMLYVFRGAIRACRRWPEWNGKMSMFEAEIAKLDKEMLQLYKSRYQKTYYIDGNIGNYE